MRHSIGALRACLVGVVIAAASAPAFSQNLGLTVDLMAPNTACSGSKCPTDISLPNLGSSIASDSMVADGTTGASVVLNTAAATPIVCSEQRGPTTFGPLGTFVFKPSYSNASPGGLFEFDAGGPSIVDATTVSLGGLGMAVLQANTASSQTACYPVSALGANSPLLADSSTAGDRVFYAQFEGGHRSDEPWVSINTVASPNGSGHMLGYVMQIHNASLAVNWHLSLGYDHAFFSDALNGGFKAKWCILSTANHPQPGAVGENGETCANATTTHIFTAGDVQAASNSIYVYVENFGSSAAVSSWATLAQSFFAASGAVFAPPGTYVQRVDDKVAVAGNVNVPTQNIGNIVCANDPLATACTITDSDGANIPASITFKNTFTVGAVALDPVAYVVDPNGATTLPGTTALAAPSNVSCADPNGILLGSVNAGSFGTSTSAAARAFAFAFKPTGTLFVPGTATCTATFTANGISSTQSFNITMQQVNVTHFDVTADSSATAGDTVNFTVTAKDGANHAVPTYTGTVSFTSSDPIAVLPSNASLTLGTGNFTATLKKAGAQTITATDTSSSTIKGTSNNVTVSASVAAGLEIEMLSHAQVGAATDMNITPVDAYGNLISSGYTGTLHFTSSDGAADLPTDAPFVTGGIYNNAVMFHGSGTQTVTATDTVDNTITGTSNNVNVSGP
jgi:hypothetical protein